MADYKKVINGHINFKSIDRDDGIVTICEIKYSDSPFEIDKQYAKNLSNKIEAFKKHSKTDKQLFIAMIVASGLKRTMYSDELIINQATLADLIKVNNNEK